MKIINKKVDFINNIQQNPINYIFHCFIVDKVFDKVRFLPFERSKKCISSTKCVVEQFYSLKLDTQTTFTSPNLTPRFLISNK